MTNQIEIGPITATETLLLRHAMLRPEQPVSESIYIGDDDPATQHWGAFVGEELIAIASLYREPLPEAAQLIALSEGQPWRLRGMAVDSTFQGQGYGRHLLARCLQSIGEHGGSLLWCNARTPAVGFYRSMGFEISGDEFVISGVGPHYVMLRAI